MQLRVKLMLKDRLKQARKNANKSQADVAEAIKITQSAYSQLETGRVDSSSHLPAIARFLGVDAFWLQTGEQPTNLDNNIDLSSKVSLDGRPVPVISWVAAGSFTPIQTVLRDAEVDEYLPPIKECGKSGYGLVVTGYSMSPKFEPEDRIYVNPDFQVSDLKTGDLVIVSCTGDNEATFKQLVIEGTTKYLQPLNPKWDEKVIKLTEGCRLVGKVVGLYRKI